MFPHHRTHPAERPPLLPLGADGQKNGKWAKKRMETQHASLLAPASGCHCICWLLGGRRVWSDTVLGCRPYFSTSLLPNSAKVGNHTQFLTFGADLEYSLKKLWNFYLFAPQTAFRCMVSCTK